MGVLILKDMRKYFLTIFWQRKAFLSRSQSPGTVKVKADTLCKMKVEIICVTREDILNLRAWEEIFILMADKYLGI